ncbi:MAG: hypothetical protein SFV15_20725 [Polyangiaceae bacterium]|nr:hypothetical protein [Polyangiaceae bacterium]
MKSWLGWWLVVLGVVLAPAAQAEVLLVPVERANITPEEGEAVGAVFADAYAEASHQQVLRATPAPKADGTPESYSDLARSKRAAEYLVVKATRLSSRIIISATRFSWDGKQIFHARMTAASFDDLEPVATRLSTAVYQQRSPETTRTLDSITEREGQKRNRLFVEKVIGVKTRYTYLKNFGSSPDYNPTLSGGFDARLEGETYFLEVGAGIILPSGGGSSDSGSSAGSVGGLYSELGGSYYLRNNDVSPYVGAGVMPQIVLRSHMDGPVALALYGQAGLMFFRQSSSRLYVDFRLAQNVLAWRDDQDYYYPELPDPVTGLSPSRPKPKANYPTEFALEVGVGW